MPQHMPINGYVVILWYTDRSRIMACWGTYGSPEEAERAQQALAEWPMVGTWEIQPFWQFYAPRVEDRA